LRNGRELRQGLFSNLANPKMAVFFTSLLPQFADSLTGLLAPGAPRAHDRRWAGQALGSALVARYGKRRAWRGKGTFSVHWAPCWESTGAKASVTDGFAPVDLAVARNGANPSPPASVPAPELASSASWTGCRTRAAAVARRMA
jgi:hypothetical protein